MTSFDSTRVVVFGLDGVGLQAPRSAVTPRLDAVAQAGFLAPVVLGPGSPTISGPSWATVASGVHPAKHRVFDNDLSGNDLASYPDFLARARAASRSTYAAGRVDRGGYARRAGRSEPCRR
jgi:predicted AlkP superfamily phosphohydrolase/phosphomutase